MESFLSFLFYFPYIPSTFVASGTAWGVTTGCLCILPSFFLSVLFFIFAFFVGLLYKRHTSARKFLLFLMIGSLLWGSSFIIEWIATIQMIVTTQELSFALRVSIITGLLQLFGAGFTGWALIVSVRSLYKKNITASQNYGTIQ